MRNVERKRWEGTRIKVGRKWKKRVEEMEKTEEDKDYSNASDDNTKYNQVPK